MINQGLANLWLIELAGFSLVFVYVCMHVCMEAGHIFHPLIHFLNAFNKVEVRSLELHLGLSIGDKD